MGTGRQRVDLLDGPVDQRSTGLSDIALKYQPDPLVLVAIASIAAALIAVGELPMIIRVPAGLVGAFVLPGYALGVALLPASSLDLAERCLLSGSLSIAVIIVAAPFLDVAGFGIRPGPVVTLLTGITIVAAAVGYWRRSGSGSVAREADVPSIYATASDDTSTRPNGRRILTWLLAAVLTAGSLSILLSSPVEPSTEFFVLGSEGLAESYPKEATAGEPVTVTVGITNGEGETLSYRVAAYSGSARVSSSESMSIESGRTWTGRLDLTMSSPGLDQEVRIDLFTGGAKEPYRTLRLWIDVLESRQG